MLRLALSLLFTAFAAFSTQAAPAKWERLDACRYVPDKSNDGDSFLVQCANAKKFFVRLYFVDAPESEASFPERVRQQYDYFGVTMDELTRGGAQARDYVQRLLANRYFNIYTRYSFAQGRSKATRYYGLVAVENRYLHEILLTEGLARNKGTRVGLPTGEKVKTYAVALQRLEDDARLRRKGVWVHSVESKRSSLL
ncbi:MAG TPA: thermonuclease family protein [Burkholderiales bacterium]|nr:thermonuclease family protein [Burkholderiales bacterium]